MTQHELRAFAWRKSSYSNGNGGSCVEVAEGLPSAVLVRDSKRAGGPALTVPAFSWAPFITAVKGESPAR